MPLVCRHCHLRPPHHAGTTSRRLHSSRRRRRTTFFHHHIWTKNVKHPTANHREPNHDFDTHINVWNPLDIFTIWKRRSTYLQARLNDDNGGGFATSATTTMEEACATKHGCSTADRWWRDETAATWKMEPLCSTTMAFANGRKNVVAAPREEDAQWRDFV